MLLASKDYVIRVAKYIVRSVMAFNIQLLNCNVLLQASQLCDLASYLHHGYADFFGRAVLSNL